MSDKYISVAAAKEAMTARFKEDVDLYGGVAIPECFDNDTANEILDKIPAADVVPSDGLTEEAKDLVRLMPGAVNSLAERLLKALEARILYGGET